MISTILKKYNKSKKSTRQGKNTIRQTKKSIKQTKKNRFTNKLKIQNGGNILISLYDLFIQWLKDIGIIERDNNETITRLKDLKKQMVKHPGRKIYGKNENSEKTKMIQKKL